MAKNQYVDGFFAFFDKYATQILVVVGGLLIYWKFKAAAPSPEESAAVADETETKTEVQKLIPPKPPKSTGNKTKDAKATQDYYAKLKETRSSQHALSLYNAMHRANAGTGLLNLNLLDGTDEDAIVRTAYEVALHRIPFAMLEKSYRAHRPLNKDVSLTKDLQSELSASEFRNVMRIMGLTPEAAAKELPKKK